LLVAVIQKRGEMEVLKSEHLSAHHYLQIKGGEMRKEEHLSLLMIQ